jgi:purine-binding chemotaxis protein CheW
MNHEQDDRPDEFAFGPDLASAFLAALDAVDDPPFVTPPPPAEEPPPPPEPVAMALEPGTLELVNTDPEPQSAAVGGAGEEELEALMTSVYASTGPMPEIEIEGQAESDTDIDPMSMSESEEVEIDLDAAYEAAARAAAQYDAGDEEQEQEPEQEPDLFTEAAAEAEADAAIEIAASEIEIEPPAELDLPGIAFGEVEADAAATAAEATAEAIAEAMAEAEGESEVLEDFEEFVAFSMGDTRCVIPIRNVVEIGRIPDAVPVPNAPVWLHGLGNLRGQVLSLIDLRAFLGIGRVRPATGRMLVLRADDEEVMAGLLVDHVHQIVSLSASRFHAVPDTLPQHYTTHAWGVCDYGNFTMIGLDVDTLLGVEYMENATNEAAVTDAV